MADRDLFELQIGILTNLRGSPVISGTGSVRKMRFSPTGTTHGKSGSHRVLYVYFEEYGVVLLVTAYPKGKRDNISPKASDLIRKMIQLQKEILSKGPIQ